jgi:endonuclease/exonuclease/phosphatase family metal-dependent hydrolase
MNKDALRVTHLAGMVELTAVLLFFYHGLRVLFSTLFGVIYDALFAQRVPMSTVGLLLGVVIVALLAPLAAPRRLRARRIVLLAAAVLVFLARIPLTLSDPQVRLLASVLIIAGTGLYLATRLRVGAEGVARALILAVVVDQLLRAAGHTFDVTLRPEWWPGQVAVSLVLCLFAGWLWRKRPGQEMATGTGLGLLGGFAWAGWLSLETSLLAFPNAVARWSGAPYSAVAPLLLAVTLLPLIEAGHWTARWGRVGSVIAGVVLVGGLAAGGLPTGPVVATGALLLVQLAALFLLPASFRTARGGPKDRVGLALSLGGLLFLVWTFAYAFAFTYPYTLAFFRDMGLPIVLVAGLMAAVPAAFRPATAQPPLRLLERVWSATLSLAAIALVILLAWPQATPPVAETSSLRMATYNIHYGFDTDWHLSLEAQAQTIEASGADVVALQEVDTGRPTSYMIDDAHWLARRLGLEVVYLPCVERLTGIALLSRYPVLDSATLLLPSDLEQTGIIWAELDLGDTSIGAFAIWMGLQPEERAQQLDAALPFITSHPGPAVWSGDFNSTPDSPVYGRIVNAGFADPFVALGLDSPPTDPSVNPAKRIDFVWLRDLQPLDARVVESIASDHRPVVVKAALP